MLVIVVAIFFSGKAKVVELHKHNERFGTRKERWMEGRKEARN